MKVILFLPSVLYRLGSRVTTLQLIRWWAESIERKDPSFRNNKTYRSLRSFDRKRKAFRHCLCCGWSVLPGYPHDCDEEELAGLMSGITRRVIAGEIPIESIDTIWEYHADKDPMGTPDFSKPSHRHRAEKGFWEKVCHALSWNPLICVLRLTQR